MSKYSLEQRKNYFEGIEAAKEDWRYCNKDNKKISDCIKTRFSLKKLCIKRKDKNGVSFQNGYLNYFLSKKKVSKTKLVDTGDGFLEPEWAMKEVAKHHRKYSDKRDELVRKRYGKLPWE